MKLGRFFKSDELWTSVQNPNTIQVIKYSNTTKAIKSSANTDSVCNISILIKDQQSPLQNKNDGS